MRTVYFDCFSGASGDMLLGALIDLGLDLDRLREELLKLPIDGYRIETRRVERSALSALKVDVIVGDRVEGSGGTVHAHPHDHGHDHAHGFSFDPLHHEEVEDEEQEEDATDTATESNSKGLVEILHLIDSSSLSPLTRQRASTAFRRLGEAEARAHGTTPETVHFHEVGAVDAIVDIVGSMAAFELLGIERFFCSSINVGGGTVDFSHGHYPVPGPATAELLRGVPIYSGAVQKELVTPTGAAIITTVVDSYGPLPPFVVDRIGYGAGTRDVPRHPNVLRAMIGTVVESGTGSDRIVVIEAAIDDMSPEALGYFIEKALADGAIDVYVTPVQMKKNRPGVALTVLVEPVDLDRISRLVFRETTTIGLRHREVSRRVLDRVLVQVETSVGPIHVKVASLDGEVVNAAPEYHDCHEAAQRTGLPLRAIQAMAAAAYAGRNE